MGFNVEYGVDVSNVHIEGKYSKHIWRFIDSDEKTIVFKCDTVKEAKQADVCVRQFIRRHELDVLCARRGNNLYLVKEEE